MYILPPHEDVLVDNHVICELKSVEVVNPLWEAQVVSYLKLTELHAGFLIKFNLRLIKDGIRRYSNKNNHLPPDY
jgi:GxxExxY protein